MDFVTNVNQSLFTNRMYVQSLRERLVPLHCNNTPENTGGYNEKQCRLTATLSVINPFNATQHILFTNRVLFFVSMLFLVAVK